MIPFTSTLLFSIVCIYLSIPSKYLVFSQSQVNLVHFYSHLATRRWGYAKYVLSLTDIAICQTKPKAKRYQLADRAGLHVLVTPAGVKAGIAFPGIR